MPNNIFLIIIYYTIGMKKFDILDYILRLLPVLAISISALWFVADIDKRISVQQEQVSSIKEQIAIYNEFDIRQSKQTRAYLMNELNQMQEEIDELNAEEYTPTDKRK